MMAEKIVQMPAPSTPSEDQWKSIIEQAEERAGHRAPMVMCRYDYYDLMTGAYAYSRMEITATGEEPYYRTARIYTDGTGEHVDQCRTDVPAVYGDMDAYTKAMAEGKPVYYVAGEENADTLSKLGMPAITRGDTTDWTPKIADIYHGAELVIVADSTVQGRLSSARIKSGLTKIAGSVKIVYPEDGQTVGQYLETHTADEAKRKFGGELGDTLDGIYGADTFVDVTADFYNEIPDKEWMIEGVITRGECAMISSAAKAGKSYLMTQLAITVASGGEWLGKFKCKKVPVLYMCGENEVNDARRRFKQLFTAMNVDPKKACEKIGMYCVDGMVNSIQSIQPALINEIRANEYGLVILDPLYCFYEGSEIDEEVAKQFVASIKTICRETGTSIVCVHHHSKGGASAYSNASSRASGSGMLQRAFSTLLDLTAIPDADQLAPLPEGVRAYSFYGEPRQAASFTINLLFAYPIWKIDGEKLLPEDAIKKSRTNKARKANGNNQKSEDIDSKLIKYIEETFKRVTLMDEAGQYVTVKDIAKTFENHEFKVTPETLAKHIDDGKAPGYCRGMTEKFKVRKTEFQSMADTLQKNIDKGRMEVVHVQGQMELPLTK